MSGITLVTGAAGFIGSHVCEALLDRGDEVVGVDELNNYYPVSLKQARVARLVVRSGFEFVHEDINDLPPSLFGADRIIHLAAWAGVRNSTKDPIQYGEANIMGTLRLLDAATRLGLESFTYASSSSAKTIASIYGATKRACDDLAEGFAAVHGLACTGLRYHTVYGPWGRPDMALWKFVRAAVDGEPIDLYNNGDMGRDFSYVADVVRATILAHDNPAPPKEPRVIDIGRGHERRLLDLVALVEGCVGKEVRRNLMPMQVGDVPSSLADLAQARDLLGFEPQWDLEQGIPAFVEWYLEHRANGGCP